MKIIMQSLLLAVIIMAVVMGVANLIVPQFNYNVQSTTPQ